MSNRERQNGDPSKGQSRQVIEQLPRQFVPNAEFDDGLPGADCLPCHC